MTHPHTLHAITAAWSLTRALEALEARALEAERDAVAGRRDGEAAIPSQVFGGRRALGGHGDPTATLAIGAWAPGTPDPNAALLGDLMRQLDQAARHLPGAPGMDPLRRIRQNIPSMRPTTAAATARALQHLDGAVRRRLGIPPDLTPLLGNPSCRACGLQLLQAHTAAPDQRDWTIVCTAGCRCKGDRCPCGMPVREAGVGHIWAMSRREAEYTHIREAVAQRRVAPSARSRR